MKNFFKKILFVCPLPALIIFCITLISAVVHAFLYVSKGFADFVNLHIAPVVRMVLAKLTNLFPFSLAETLLLFMPVIVVSLIIFVVRIPRDDVVKMKRCTFSLLAAIGYLYSTFALGFAASYRGTSLADKIGLERTAVSAEELDYTARALYNEIEKLIVEKGIRIHKAYVGNYFTSLDMMGATLTVMKLDDELKELIDLDCNTMGLTQV